MYRRFACLGFLLAPALVLISCSGRLLSQRLQALQDAETVTVVVYSAELAGSSWLGGSDTSFNTFLRDSLQDLFGCPVAIINNSDPDATYASAISHFDELFGSYRPDIVFVLLGTCDVMTTGLSMEGHREHAEQLFRMFHESGIFVVALTGIGFQSFEEGYDRRLDRLNEFNEITVWKAGSYFPIIDTGQYCERLRTTAPDAYRNLFSNDYVLNDEGKRYVFEYVLDRLRRAAR